MTTIADFTIPSTEFVLGWTLAAVPEATVEVERVVADANQRVTPYFWVTGDRADEFDAVLADDPSVASVRLLDETPDGRFYRARWTESIEPLIYVLDDAHGTILSAVGRDAKWDVRVLFPDRAALSGFHEFCAAHDLSFRLRRLYEPSGTKPLAAPDLTDEQSEALKLAFDLGYFSVPRDVTMSDLAAELDVSTTAVSKRLRRAHDRVLRQVFPPG